MSDAVARLNVALEGRYRIERPVGEGGMAMVYLAHDLRHDRNVALKVLKPELAAVVGAERFLAEIKTTAKLQHPHILPLHDSGEADRFLFYVMPYVEGETLRGRIDREKQLPVAEAVRIATAVANALHTAHQHGIVHRDIKPGNVLLSQGEPLIADFGIALAVGAAGAGRLTETGLSVGTPYYMSPEQATGDVQVGAATDIYALGCVLYEMLTGEPPYLGNTAQAVLGKIIQGAPVSATATRKSVPPHVDAAIRKALEKLPADRFADARDFAHALSDPSFRHGEVGAAELTSSRRTRLLAYAGWGAAATLAGILAWTLTRPTPYARVERFSMPFEPDQELAFLGTAGFNLSPDGTMFAYRGVVDGTQILVVRRWDDIRATPVRETAGALMPAFSPDGRELAFVQGGEIRVLALAGGPVRTIGPGLYPRWGPDGFLHTSADSGAVRFPATGGNAQLVTRSTAGGPTHHVWDVLPGGDQALMLVGPNAAEPEIHVVDLASGEHERVLSGNWARYAPSGHILYLLDGTLLAVPFDGARAELTGAAVPVMNDVLAFSLSDDGKLFYTTGIGGQQVLRQLVWVDRSGRTSVPDPSWTWDRGADVNAGWRLSPDGSRVALREFAADNYDIWVKQLPQGPHSRLTFDPAHDRMPFWSPDGRSLGFLSDVGGNLDVWTRPADGTGSPTLILDMEAGLATAEWSPDGEWLLVRTGGVGGAIGGRDIYAYRPGVDSEAFPLLVAAHDEVDPTVSPDGRWLAYTSNETGRYEVFVRPFPDVESGRWQISVNGGRGARWARNGREIFFRDAADNFVRVAVVPGAAFEHGSPETLFEIPDGIQLADITFGYDDAPDGQRFLVASTEVGSPADEDEGDTPRAILVTNFFEELRRLAPR